MNAVPPLTPGEQALLIEFAPLYEAEWDRLGISRDDQRWIHSGWNELPTREQCVAGLASLRGLAAGIGPVAYCAHLGFDYVTMKRDIELL